MPSSLFHQSALADGEPGGATPTDTVVGGGIAAMAAFSEFLLTNCPPADSPVRSGAVGAPVSAGEASGAFAARSLTRFVTSDCAMGRVVGNVAGLPLTSVHAMGTVGGNVAGLPLTSVHAIGRVGGNVAGLLAMSAQSSVCHVVAKSTFDDLIRYWPVVPPAGTG